MPTAQPWIAQPWITDEDTLAALPVDRESFPYQYCMWASRWTDAPLAYHLGTAYGLIAAVTPERLTIERMPGGPVPANFWALFIGRQAADRKSTAIRLGRRLLEGTISDRLAEQPGSAEALIDSLPNATVQLLCLPEFGRFLAETEGQSYLMKLKATLTDIYDGSVISRNTKGGGVVRVDNPRLSLLGGVTPAFLERHTEPADWEGGFLSRACLLFARRSRTLLRPVDPEEDKEMEDLRQRLVALSYASYVQSCVGLTDAAWELWTDWNARLEAQDTGGGFECLHGRAPNVALKVALLLGFDAVVRYNVTQPWLIDIPLLQPGIVLADLHVRSARAMSIYVCPSRDMRERRAFLRALTRDFRTFGEILRDAQLLKQRGRLVLDTLLEERAVEVVQSDQGMLIRLAMPIEVLAPPMPEPDSATEEPASTAGRAASATPATPVAIDGGDAPTPVADESPPRPTAYSISARPEPAEA